MIPQTFVNIDYLLNYLGVKLLQLLQDAACFLHSLFCLLFFYCYKVILGFCNSSLYPSFIWNTVNPVGVNMNKRIGR